MGVAGVGEHVAQGGPRGRHALDDGDDGDDGVEVTGGEGEAPNELGDGLGPLVSDHGGDREVVAEEQLVDLAGVGMRAT
jgi:hypothetical protein